LEPTSSEQKIAETYEQKVLKKYVKNFRKWSKKFLEKKSKNLPTASNREDGKVRSLWNSTLRLICLGKTVSAACISICCESLDVQYQCKQ
jgi:hypothetical protein